MLPHYLVKCECCGPWCILFVAVCAMEVLEFLRCLYVSHWKELSAEMEHSTAVQRWCAVWVRPVLELFTCSSMSHSLRHRLSDVRMTLCSTTTQWSYLVVFISQERLLHCCVDCNEPSRSAGGLGRQSIHTLHNSYNL